MALICPFAEWRPLPEAESQPRITPRVAIFHTAVGTLRGVEAYFRDRTGIESHFMVGGPWDGPDLDGVIWQWMSLDRQADANLDANAFAISIESSDNAPGRPEDIVPWSPKQLASLVRLGNWLADTFTIPRQRCPAWDAAGFGWHAMWGAPSHWTPAVGKVCPGPARIRQLKETVFPAIFAGQTLEDDMTKDEHDALMWLRANLVGVRDQGVRMTDHGDPDTPGRSNNLAVVRGDLAALQATLEAAPAPLPVAVDEAAAAAIAQDLAANADFLRAIAVAVADETYRRQAG